MDNVQNLHSYKLEKRASSQLHEKHSLGMFVTRNLTSLVRYSIELTTQEPHAGSSNVECNQTPSSDSRVGLTGGRNVSVFCSFGAMNALELVT
jgi:hypothetical protein